MYLQITSLLRPRDRLKSLTDSTNNANNSNISSAVIAAEQADNTVEQSQVFLIPTLNFLSHQPVEEIHTEWHNAEDNFGNEHDEDDYKSNHTFVIASTNTNITTTEETESIQVIKTEISEKTQQEFIFDLNDSLSLSSFIDEPTSSISIEMNSEAAATTTTTTGSTGTGLGNTNNTSTDYNSSNTPASMQTTSTNEGQAASSSIVSSSFAANSPASSLSIEEEIEEALEISEEIASESVSEMPLFKTENDKHSALDLKPSNTSQKSSNISEDLTSALKTQESPLKSMDNLKSKSLNDFEDEQFKIDDDQLTGGKLAQHFVLNDDEDDDSFDISLPLEKSVKPPHSLHDFSDEELPKNLLPNQAKQMPHSLHETSEEDEDANKISSFEKNKKQSVSPLQDEEEESEKENISFSSNRNSKSNSDDSKALPHLILKEKAIIHYASVHSTHVESSEESSSSKLLRELKANSLKDSVSLGESTNEDISEMQIEAESLSEQLELPSPEIESAKTITTEDKGKSEVSEIIPQVAENLMPSNEVKEKTLTEKNVRSTKAAEAIQNEELSVISLRNEEESETATSEKNEELEKEKTEISEMNSQVVDSPNKVELPLINANEALQNQESSEISSQVALSKTKTVEGNSAEMMPKTESSQFSSIDDVMKPVQQAELTSQDKEITEEVEETMSFAADNDAATDLQTKQSEKIAQCDDLPVSDKQIVMQSQKSLTENSSSRATSRFLQDLHADSAETIGNSENPQKDDKNSPNNSEKDHSIEEIVENQTMSFHDVSSLNSSFDINNETFVNRLLADTLEQIIPEEPMEKTLIVTDLDDSAEDKELLTNSQLEKATEVIELQAAAEKPAVLKPLNSSDNLLDTNTQQQVVKKSSPSRLSVHQILQAAKQEEPELCSGSFLPQNSQEDDDDEEEDSMELMKLRILAMKFQAKEQSQNALENSQNSPTESPINQAVVNETIKQMERVPLGEYTKDILEDITEESERNSISTTLEEQTSLSMEANREHKTAEQQQQENSKDETETNNSMVSLQMIQMLEQKVTDLKDMLASKDACLASLNMQLESTQRRDSAANLSEQPISGRETISSIVTSSTEYITFQEDYGSGAVSINIFLYI